MGDMAGEPNTLPIKFNIFTREFDAKTLEFTPGTLKAFRDPDGKMRLSGIASSTVKDLHGDTMLASALADMENAANNNLTIFGNHSYEVPEDVYGSVESARYTPAGLTDKSGDPVHDLHFEVRINEVNPRAIDTWKAIDGGTKLGLSIGAMIPEGGAIKDKKNGTYTIAHVELVETSIVGIPANPRSWIDSAVKSIKSAHGPQEVPVEKLEWTTRTVVTEADPSIDLEASEKGIETFTCETCGWVQPKSFAEIPCSNCEREAAGPTESLSSQESVDPEITDTVVKIEIDTQEKQPVEAPQSDPKAALADETAEGDDEKLGNDVTRTVDTAKEVISSNVSVEVTSAFKQLLDLTDHLTKSLVEAKTEERKALAAKAMAEQQRDEAIHATEMVLARTSELLNKLANEPVGRRTVFREAESSLATLEGIYSRDFLTKLRSKNV
jgi:HK97 family phage prohead protease